MITPTPVSDSQISALLEQIAAGDCDAMHQFHDLVKPRVLRSLRRILRDPSQIEEAAQDVSATSGSRPLLLTAPVLHPSRGSR